MIIRTIVIENWGPYRGYHVLDLSNKVYGIIGKHESDEGRSNWLGKTWFLSTIKFALHGAKPDNVLTEDDYITDGESKAYVNLILDDGFNIMRSRKRGSSTQLEVVVDKEKSRQTEAQKIIDKHIGMNHTDFIASCFIGQKQISKLITVRPNERTKIVNNWFDLEKLQKAESIAKDRLNDLLSDIADHEKTKQSLTDRLPEIDRTSVEKDIKKTDRELKLSQKKLDKLNSKLDNMDDWLRHDTRYEQYINIEEKGLRLTELNKKFDIKKYNEFEKEEKELYSDFRDAESRYDFLKDLQSGEEEFDGVCPITCDNCFAIDEVKDKVTKMGEEVGFAEIKVDQIQEKHKKVKEELVKFDKFLQRKRQIDILREEIIRLSDSYVYIKENGRPEDPSKYRAQSQELSAKISDLKNQYHELSNQVRKYDEYTEKIKELDADLDEMNKQVKIAHESISVFGRNGVQRVIAEGAIKEIEQDANQSLVDAGIDLSIDVTWSRTGQGLATHCESCGSPFPASRKVKVCSHCKTPRGPKIIDELDIKPSDRSGAADDIAGLEFQLSAAKWLRTDRGSDWSSVFIDEPFGALDKTNGTLLSTHLHSMIRNQYSFDQGFIVAHDSAIMSSLPAIIQVTGTDNGSKLEVL
jgi:DNA repair exonuclease SbcCD ATPase subunit